MWYIMGFWDWVGTFVCLALVFGWFAGVLYFWNDNPPTNNPDDWEKR